MSNNTIRYSLHLKEKVHRVMLEFCTKYKSLYKEQEVMDLGFSLYTILSVCYKITTSKEWMEFKSVSSDKINVLS